MLLTDTRGLPLGYTIVPANEQEYEPLADLLTGTPATVVVADKGFWDATTRLGWPPTAPPCSRPTRPARARTSAANARSPRPAWSSRASSPTSKSEMRLERHLARTPAGLAVRIAQRILALTIGMLLNTTQRPPRARARRLRRPAVAATYSSRTGDGRKPLTVR